MITTPNVQSTKILQRLTLLRRGEGKGGILFYRHPKGHNKAYDNLKSKLLRLSHPEQFIL